MKSSTSVHPHARGDNASASLRSAPPRFSPPRAWGQRNSCRRFRRCDIFTPTRVGTTLLLTTRWGTDRLHPHARGDNASPLVPSPAAPPSPPRAWGQRTTRSFALIFWRFTPTRVGTTRRLRQRMKGMKVHPHARGDNSTAAAWSVQRCGSPPRAWGQLSHGPLLSLACRFTPTRVGTTSPWLPLPDTAAVHPHARGDNPMGSAPLPRMRGSPPRAWGQLQTVATRPG